MACMDEWAKIPQVSLTLLDITERGLLLLFSSGRLQLMLIEDMLLILLNENNTIIKK